MGRRSFIAISVLLLCCASRSLSADSASQVLAQSGIQGGLVVHLGCGDGTFTAELDVSDRYLVQGLDTNPAQVAEARRNILSLGKQGCVSVSSWDGGRLPYVDGIANLIIADDPARVTRSEISRVLAPGGVFVLRSDVRSDLADFRKPWPDEIDRWTHFLHSPGNNAVAHDSKVGLPRTLQWDCGPKYCRSHELDISVAASVTDGGKLFSIVDKGPPGIIARNVPDKWVLEARDAFNGILLWERPMTDWSWRVWKPELLKLDSWTSLIAQRRLVPATLPRRLVTADGVVYLTFGVGEPVVAVDADSGETIQAYAGTEGTDEILLDRGMLLLTVRPSQRETALSNPDLSLQAQSSRKPMGVKEDGVVKAVDASTGERLWQAPDSQVVPFTLAANGPRVFYHTGQDLVCLDRETGREVWRQANTTTKSTRWEVQHILVAYKDVVLLALPKSTCQAFDAATGRLLWTGKGGRASAFATTPLEMFVIDDLMWFTSGTTVEGKDIHTGEVMRTIDLPTYLHTPGHHLRCYRARATDRFILDNKRGIEFVDLIGQEHQKNDWVRGACRYGILPANGLIYSTPTPCSCYATVLLTGFNALSDAMPPSAEAPKLMKGAAFGMQTSDDDESKRSAAADWPTLRGNVAREGTTATAVGLQLSIDRSIVVGSYARQSVDSRRLATAATTNRTVISRTMLKAAWSKQLGGKLTQPVSADGRIYVCSREKQTLFALDSSSGKILWEFAGAAEIDSPPTYWKGMLLFGCRDGWIYNLRASDGELAWRFRAAPVERQIVSYGRLESSWPVQGSLLVLAEDDRDVVYAAAGRNSYIDGGIYLYGLDAESGQMVYEHRLANPPQDGEKKYAPHELEGAKPDVMVFDGTYISMQSKVFDRQLNPVRQPAAPHLYATGGLLDDQAWHRNFWLFAPGWTVTNKSANTFPNVGQLLVHEPGLTYGVKYFMEHQGQSRVFYPEQQGYYLFCDRDDQMFDRLLVSTFDPSAAKEKTSSREKRSQNAPRANVWGSWVPLRVRAMVKAGGTLFVAGPPDRIPAADPLAPFEGRGAGEVWAVDASTGEIQSKLLLDTLPVFDGMIAAGGRLILATEDGTVKCWDGEED